MSHLGNFPLCNAIQTVRPLFRLTYVVTIERLPERESWLKSSYHMRGDAVLYDAYQAHSLFHFFEFNTICIVFEDNLGSKLLLDYLLLARWVRISGKFRWKLPTNFLVRDLIDGLMGATCWVCKAFPLTDKCSYRLEFFCFFNSKPFNKRAVESNNARPT